MLDPPDYATSIVTPHAELVDHRGSAWMYRVLASHQGQGRSYSRSH
jgi:hypothetical protein